MVDVSYKQIEQYLKDVKMSVLAGKYTISSREKNEELYIDYIFSEERCKEILLDLQVEDFSYADNNQHPQYPEEVLYIFGKEVDLIPRFGEDIETVALYIKFNKQDNMYVIVVSFHKQKYPLKYKFK